jgi:hypothetical protein
VVVPVKLRGVPAHIGELLAADADKADATVANEAVIEVLLFILSVPAPLVAPHPTNLKVSVWPGLIHALPGIVQVSPDPECAVGIVVPKRISGPPSTEYAI